MTIITAIAAALVLAVCLLFVLHRDFHAGMVGNAGLGMVAIVAASRLITIYEYGWAHQIPPQATVLWIGLALFLGRQAARFLWRYSTRCGWYEGPRNVVRTGPPMPVPACTARPK